MYDVKIKYPTDVVEIDSVSKTNFNQLFKGSEIAVVGECLAFCTHNISGNENKY